MSINKPKFAYLAGGCFWCLDAAFRQAVGVVSVMSGYTGGHQADPSYEDVSAGKTGHAETVQIEYDPAMVTYRYLLELFFRLHDPTTLNRQGNDVGTQYRSAVYYQDEDERRAATALIAELEAEQTYARPIVTEVAPLKAFYPAEDYHQDYYAKHPDAAYCRAVIRPKLDKVVK